MLAIPIMVIAATIVFASSSAIPKDVMAISPIWDTITCCVCHYLAYFVLSFREQKNH